MWPQFLGLGLLYNFSCAQNICLMCNNTFLSDLIIQANWIQMGMNCLQFVHQTFQSRLNFSVFQEGQLTLEKLTLDSPFSRFMYSLGVVLSTLQTNR